MDGTQEEGGYHYAARTCDTLLIAPNHGFKCDIIKYRFIILSGLSGRHNLATTTTFMDVFKSKIDKWLLFCLILSVIACLLGAFVALKIGGSGNYVFAVFMLVAGAGFPLWIIFSTQYIVEGENLEITSGPFTWKIPIDSITALRDSKSILANPALSLDRLEIVYGEDKAILVSPVDKMKFIEKLGIEKYAGMRKNKRRISKDKTSGNHKKKQNSNR